VAVSGRTYPVALRYRPYGAEGEPGDDRDQVQAVIEAVAELSAEGPGDVLVFLSGEREIRDTADALTAAVGVTTEILPLYSRLSAAEQHRVFEPHSGRRVVLATNVAETSLTVPGVRYVVDPGTARISRYSHRSKVQRLPIEAISQASANQRAGRCGRVADGIAVRLYAEADFAARPEFTEPEILRTNLASVILSMTALGLGDIAGFPFLEPPDRRAIRDGVELLHELGALEPHAAATGARITDLGRSLAALPLDPRLGRMVIEGDRLGCLEQVLIVTAALSIQDPRERPTDKTAQADQLHARFRDPTSDFASYLRLWDYLGEQQESLSGNQFRRLCRREYLHYLRVREWQDVHAQLRRTCRELRLGRSSAPGDGERLHTALLAGLLAHVGAHDGERRDYLGARGRRFVIHPGSGLARKPPPFVVAAELVETSRLFARVVARVDPRWVEQVAGELVTRRYSEPRWSRRRAGVVATEKVSLYGVPLVAGRSVPYARVDPVACRELFLRHALVLGDWDAHHGFLRVNEALVREAGELEERTRRRDLLTDEEVLVDFFDARVPASVTGGRAFDRWWKTERRTRPDLLTYPRELLLPDPDDDLEDDFPRVWTFGDSALPDLPLAYAFEPGTAHDGVSVEVPLGLLPQLSAQDFLRQVPGRREEVVTALVRSLPKALRTRFVPVPDTVRAVLPELAGDRPLPEALATALTRLGGVAVPVEALDPDSLPDHLRVTFRVVDEAGRQVGQGRDLAVLTHELAPVLRSSLAASAPELEQTGLTRFPADALPERVSTTVGGHEVTGYPALVDRGRHVDLVVLTAPDEQSLAMAGGIRRLLLLALPSPLKAAVAGLDTRSKLALGHTPYDDVPTML
ncbi:MAG TPA: ATP-dependent RNA helicase HrpA, partial [Candidatus Nanopelagicales bacterium]|nr:ATP-dependent RNA helicase HrpA [Candidatus Nanopelagicales bacterium]